MTALLDVNGLTKHFPVRRGVLRRTVGTVRAVEDVSLAIAPGTTLALVGESGCGKSTLGRMILRLLEPTSGTVSLDGRDVTALSGAALRAVRRDMQIIFQDPFGSLNPRMTVRETVREPLVLHSVAEGAAADAAVDEILALVGLQPFHAGRYPHEFSGGQRQRIGIARALATRPRLVVCDEAVSALDVSVQAQIINLLKDLQERFGIAYVFISHDLAVVRQIAERVAVMYLGRIVEEGPVDALFAAPRHPYTRSLIEAAPRPDPAVAAHAPLKGDMPSAMAPPGGCAFHTRCPIAHLRCRDERPVMRPLGGTMVACHYAEETPAAPPTPPTPRSPALTERLAVLARASAAQPRT
ncbi:ABC transporter ATP-binding protein [Acuticoccus sediminis]|uniref:ABC transporter ATP-binding protein n=1 Tax=Acuticoccus sediminis TaxID=2184697 RepID=UPI001CFE97D8|nr:oligopeptide/dipeptide ABC transporter ATP-binding protein [Acuticoccus sediminis]